MALEQVIKANLLHKTEDIRQRYMKTIKQLNEEQINWRFNHECNSIANIIVHINGNAVQRLESDIQRKPDIRNRDAEFESSVQLSQLKAEQLIEHTFDLLQSTIKNTTGEGLLAMRIIREKPVTVYDILIQCIAHFSEHLGQVLYVAKMLLAENYVTVSIPKKRPS